MRSVQELRVFSREAGALLVREDRDALIGTLAREPLSGDAIVGLGGVRKMRFAPAGRGKSGAFRVVFHPGSEELPVLALLIYAKNEQDDVSADQRKAILALLRELGR